ncbi:MAG TPA: SCO1664 family protein [Acidimicrobiales bacterium]|nr:SCO1664 family protein [Acidimicrobiales bacterium]
MSADQRASSASALTILAEGEVEIQGRMPWSSNRTFLVTVSLDGTDLAAVYKPGRGERPLWDFPDGLYQREVAAYELSRWLGWDLVPETVLREDGPLGEGSMQRFVNADFDQHYFTLLDDERHHEALKAMAAFDVAANNADRKGGHCLIDADGHVWGVDHGLCFHVAPKLRTVIWDFSGAPVPENVRDDLRRLAACPPAALDTLLDPAEIGAITRRATSLARLGVFPDPGEGRPYPWPLV